MTVRPSLIAALFASFSVLPAAAIHAQPLGTFNWQLQPYCNHLTVNVTQQGSVYTIDGYDDQCGAPQRAPLVGTAGLNPDGTIGIGLHIVTVPGGRGVDIDARVSLSSLSGPWSDSAGNSGTFAFNARTFGLPRPVPTVPAAALTPGSITSAQLAAAAVTTANVADGSITPQKLSVGMPRLQTSGLTTGVVGLPLDVNVVVQSVTMAIPSAGQVMATASGLFAFFTGGSNYTIGGWCSISTGVTVETSHSMNVRLFAPIMAENLPFAGTRVYDVTPGPFTLRLVCMAYGNPPPFPPPFFPVMIHTAGLTALFVPS